MKKCILAFIMLLYGSVAFSADHKSLVSGTAYTADEKAQIAALFREADRKGLPVDLLSNKVKEAVMKRVRFGVLFPVMEQRFALMAEADAVMTEKKIAARDRRYAVQVLTELQEKGVKRQAYGRMVDAAAGKGKSFDDVAGYFDVLGKYHSGEVPANHYADILAACITRSVSPARGEKLLYLFTEARRNNMPPDAAKEAILDGIARNRRIEEIGDALRYGGAREGVLPENGRRGPEREAARGFPGDEYRGRTETGGNGTYRGK
ncbi:MAG: hypothetical protein ACYC5N_07780 [Endomicrobiales bacterium]